MKIFGIDINIGKSTEQLAKDAVAAYVKQQGTDKAMRWLNSQVYGAAKGAKVSTYSESLNDDGTPKLF